MELVVRTRVQHVVSREGAVGNDPTFVNELWEDVGSVLSLNGTNGRENKLRTSFVPTDSPHIILTRVTRRGAWRSAASAVAPAPMRLAWWRRTEQFSVSLVLTSHCWTASRSGARMRQC